jgi:hypothetical protein
MGYGSIAQAYPDIEGAKLEMIIEPIPCLVTNPYIGLLL